MSIKLCLFSAAIAVSILRPQYSFAKEFISIAYDGNVQYYSAISDTSDSAKAQVLTKCGSTCTVIATSDDNCVAVDQLMIKRHGWRNDDDGSVPMREVEDHGPGVGTGDNSDKAQRAADKETNKLCPKDPTYESGHKDCSVSPRAVACQDGFFQQFVAEEKQKQDETNEHARKCEKQLERLNEDCGTTGCISEEQDDYISEDCRTYRPYR